ncbi:P-type conjugative transfer ATPase TrbB [Desulfosarcina sp. OttesenSCG-928-A07]|nr:P-type conjugative transfer ATPase TrbB [Desulfosarcina sp. OttesenSCG-928-G17]MDL2328465.1 P-type conjugative transfer ATPase TrbB [Desulfosarcina sp. OttesenSCG-928-A07]
MITNTDNNKRLLANLEYNLGPVIMQSLRDPEVVEVILNSDGKIWVERLGKKMEVAGHMEPAQGKLVISLIASSLETIVTAANPIVEGELPIDGSRFEGSLPPVCSAPSFAIRKKAIRVYSLENYAEQGILPEWLLPELKEALAKHQNILVVGGTGSGKTTFVNALIRSLSEICPDDRLVILEDTRELQSLSPNTQFYRTSDDVDMTRLLRMTMRIRPDRILIGEVRDGAALALLKAWNTGHPGGIATVHANGAEEGLFRLEELIAEATQAPKHQLIGNAVDKVIFIERAPGGRCISEVLNVSGYDVKNMCYKTEHVYLKSRC